MDRMKNRLDMQKGNICLVLGDEVVCSSQMTGRASFLTSPYTSLSASLESGNLCCHLSILFTYFQLSMTATEQCGVSGISEEDS